MNTKQIDEQLEALRREKSNTNLGATVVHLHNADIRQAAGSVDYGSAGLKVDRAKHHLDESIPNKQHDRTCAAYRALREGADELYLWLKLNGYKV